MRTTSTVSSRPTAALEARRRAGLPAAGWRERCRGGMARTACCEASASFCCLAAERWHKLCSKEGKSSKAAGCGGVG